MSPNSNVKSSGKKSSKKNKEKVGGEKLEEFMTKIDDMNDKVMRCI
jgi:hypothetical protein